MKYFFTPDKAVIITSILCIVAIGYMLYCFVNADKWYYDISSLLVVGLFIFFALKTPYCVYVGDDSVVVKQVMGSIKITDIESIRSVGKKDLANSIRKFGNGGFFGYVGYFSSPHAGQLLYGCRKYKRVGNSFYTEGENLCNQLSALFT